jgi:O-antigen/teichoic acid export membrane protein
MKETEPAAPRVDPAGDVRHAARGGLLQLLAALGQGLMPVTHVLMARLYGLPTFGAFQANAAIVDLLSRGGPVGSVGSMHRFIAAHRATGEEDLAQRALGTGLRLTVVVSTVLALAAGLLAPVVAWAWNEASVTATLPIMAPAVLLSALTMVLVAATLGTKVARMNLYVRGIAEPMLLLAAVFIGWRLGGGLRNLAVAYVATGVVVAALAVAACIRVFGRPYLRRALASPRHPGFLRFALPFGVSDVMIAILQRADAFLVATFAGFDALAVYAAAEYITRLIANPRYLFDNILAPVIAEALQMGDRARVRYNLALMTRWVTIACAPIAVTVIVLRAEILHLYGGTFAAGASSLVILSIAHFFIGCLGLTPYVISMGGRSRLLLLNTFSAAALNVVLGVVLVPRMGISGAAVAVLVSATAFQVALTIEAWIIERVHPFTAALVKPLVAAAAMLAVEIGIRGLVHGLPARFALVIAGGLATYLAALLALGIGSEEREIVEKLNARLRARFGRF